VGFVISQTDPPTGDALRRGTLWFQRGEGRLMLYQPVPLPTGVTTGSAPTDFKWVQVGGEKRTNIVFVRQSMLQGELCSTLLEVSGGTGQKPSETLGNVTDGRFKSVRSIDDSHTLVIGSTSPHSGHVNRSFACDPQFVCETQLTSVTDYFTVADWGFVDALCFGDGKYACIYGHHSSGATEGSSHLYAQCTTHSAAGEDGTIMGFRVGSTATDGLRLATLFKRPSLTNMVHGD